MARDLGEAEPAGGHDLVGLAISVWHETKQSQAFRARVISRTNSSTETLIIYAKSSEEVLSAVEEWLRKLSES